ncbi:MAG: hypothetical protein RIQ72_94 [Candidatus Parcubacteria bacterium]|jgi:hypothetical protein
MDTQGHSSVFLEAYKQEMENVRFFEDIFFKLHFFVLSGFVVIGGYLLEKKMMSNLIVLFFINLIIMCILMLVFETDKKHTARMRRLVKIQGYIGLNSVYGNYVKRFTSRGIMFISLYAVLLTITFSMFVFKIIQIGMLGN